MKRNFGISFHKIPSALDPSGCGTATGADARPLFPVAATVQKTDPEAVGGNKRLPGPRIALVGGTSREPIRQPALRHSSDGSQVDWGGFGRSPFIPRNAQATFPPFNLSKSMVHEIFLFLLLALVVAVICAIPLTVSLLFIAGF